MGWEYPSDILWRAQELYCVDRLSYTAVAEATGVSATTLKAWGQKYNWAERRCEIAQTESEIRINIIKGRKKALEQLLAAQDAKEAAPMAFAVSSLENLALKRMELAQSGKIPTDAPKIRHKIATKADAITALREAIELKIGGALADPEKITTTTVQDIKRILELMSEMEATLPRESTADSHTVNALSPENARMISAILGTGEQPEKQGNKNESC